MVFVLGIHWFNLELVAFCTFFYLQCEIHVPKHHVTERWTVGVVQEDWSDLMLDIDYK